LRPTPPYRRNRPPYRRNRTIAMHRFWKLFFPENCSSLFFLLPSPLGCVCTCPLLSLSPAWTWHDCRHSTWGVSVGFLECTGIQYSNYRGDGGIFPPLPIVIPGTITALYLLSPPLARGMGIKKISHFNAYPPLYFFANSSAAGMSMSRTSPLRVGQSFLISVHS